MQSPVTAPATADPWSGFQTEATWRVATALDNNAGAHRYLRDMVAFTTPARFTAALAFACARRFESAIICNGAYLFDPTIRWAILAEHWAAQ